MSNEINRLQTLYDDEKNRIVLFYGRSGLNKRTELREFLSDKKSIYYDAMECSMEYQREYFAKTVRTICDVSIPKDDYVTIFNRVKSGDASKLVLIVDHFENMVKKDPSFFDALIKLRAKKLYPGPVMVILLSDSLVFCENQLSEILEDKMKYIDVTIKSKELNFIDVVRYFPNYSVSESVKVYGILGGVPDYLERWDETKTFKENICHLMLEKDGYLYNMAHEYLAAELREYGVYNTILATIAAGNEKLNDIFEKTAYSRPKISVYIKTLSDFEVIEKVISFQTGGWENAKKGIYRISNTYLNFYYKFIFPNESLLFRLGAEAFYDIYIKDELENYLDRAFVKVCMEYLELSSSINKLPIKISKLGTWIGKNGNIDIIAQDSMRNTITGICSWSEECFTYDMYENLLKRINEAKVKSERCYLFSAKKFDSRILNAAKDDETIVIVNMNEL